MTFPDKAQEQQWIRRALGGDPEAYANLVRAHQDRVLSVCRSVLRNPTEAEDAAQEVFLKAYRSLAQFRMESSFSTWLYRIATHVSLDRLRARARTPTESLDAASDGPFPHEDPRLIDPVSHTQTLETRDLVERILGTLLPDHRMVLVLREIEGLSYEEIARVMGTSLESVRARLFRAREALLQAARHFGLLPDVSLIEDKP